MRFTQQETSVAERIQTVLDRPLHVAEDRLAQYGRDASLQVAADAPGTLTAESHRVALAGVDGAVVTVELTAFSPTTTLLEVAADNAAGATLAAGVADAVAGPRPSPPARPHGWAAVRRPVLRGAAAVLVVLLAVGGLKVHDMLTPPAPLDLAAAVAQYQSVQSPPSAALPQPRSRQSVRSRSSVPADTDTSQPAGGRGKPEGRPGSAPTRQLEAPNAGASVQPQRGAQPAAPRNAGREPGSAVPEPGVYSFQTTGYESIDKPGGRHDYPSRTAYTVQQTDCGFTTRWQPLEERWDELALCEGEPRTLERMSTNREFYGESKRTEYRCEPGTPAWDTRPQARWTARCSDADTTVETTFQVVGREAVQVGGEVVEAVHLSVRGRLRGGTEGTITAERWLHAETGLLLRMTSRTSATSGSSVGEIRYTEQVELALESLQPQR